MATLNSMRTRWGWIVTGIIGLALLMFVVQDLFTSGSAIFNQNSVGRIAGKNISYENFVEQHDRLEAVYQLMYNLPSIPSEQQQAIYEQVWQQMILDYAFSPSFARMGLTIGGSEQLAMTESGPFLATPYAQFFTNPQTGQFEAEALRNFAAQVKTNNQAYAIWNFLKQQAIIDRLINNYFALVGSGFAVNDISVAKAVTGSNTSYDARGFYVPYTSIADSIVNIPYSAIKKYYNDHKSQFKQSVSREVEYVVFDLTPSTADFAVADKDIRELAEEFRTTANPLQYITISAKLRLAADTTYQRAADLKTDLKEVADRGFVEPTLIGNTYTMARLVGSKIQSDTVGFEVGGEDAGRYQIARLNPELQAKVIAARVGETIIMGSGEGAQTIKITYKNAPVKMVQIAKVSYTVYPSAETQSRVYNATADFIARAGKTAEGFKTAVEESGMSKRIVRITPEMRTIDGLNDGKALINWAYGVKTKRGAVSEMMQIDGNYIIATLSDIQKEGYLPLDQQIEARIRTELIQQEKARMITATISGNTLEAMAGSVNADIENIYGAVQTMPFLMNFGYEPKVVGAISALKVGAISKPIAGNAGVYVVLLEGINTVNDVMADELRVRLNANSTMNLNQRLMTAIFQLSKIRDMRVRYF